MSRIQSVDLPIQCSCGALRGVVRDASAESGNRCVCYCDDCQSFAHFLKRADEILDVHGGTDIYQMSSGRLELSVGADRLACMQLTESGMLRWYARCCKAPIGNTLRTNKVPFVGLIHACIGQLATDGRSRDELLGPIRMRGFARFATGDRAGLNAEDGAPPAMGVRVTELIQRALERGEQDRSPFFDHSTGESVVSPRVLSIPELHELEKVRDEAAG